MEFVIVTVVIIGGYVLFRGMSRFRSSDASGGRAGQFARPRVNDLDAFFASSYDQPRLLFLYDPFCPVSALASRQIARVDYEIATIDVSNQGELTRQLEWRTGIRHESPQVMLIDHGSAVWHESHSRINQKSITHAIDGIAARRVEPSAREDEVFA